MTPEEMYAEHEKLVWFVLNRYYPDFVYDEDVAQEARIGLWLACKAYDPSRGAFSTFAVKTIHNEVRGYFRRMLQRDIPRDQLVSLEHPVKDMSHGGDPVPLRDTLVGESDIQWMDLSGVKAKLGDLDLRIFRLRLTGLSMDDIGARVGISRQAVDKRLEKIEDLVRRYI